MKTNLDIVNDSDRFPYKETDPDAYEALLSTLYTLVWNQDGQIIPIGYITENVLNELIDTPESIKGDFALSRQTRQVAIFQQATEEERSRQAAKLANYWREKKAFRILNGWRNELYPIYGPGNEILYSIERVAAALFGVVTYGVHLNAYTKSPESSHGIKLWIPRRAAGKQTYAGMLDNTVAGGKATGEDPLECLIRECDEEASLSEELVRGSVKAHGTVTYLYIRNEQATGEVGLIQPECQYIFDLELPNGMAPKPNDSEVEEFYLWTVEEVQEHIQKGEFKPNCALVMLDFLIRHGILTKENEKDYDEIKRRTRRDLVFPGTYKA